MAAVGCVTLDLTGFFETHRSTDSTGLVEGATDGSIDGLLTVTPVEMTAVEGKRDTAGGRDSRSGRVLFRLLEGDESLTVG